MCMCIYMIMVRSCVGCLEKVFVFFFLRIIYMECVYVYVRWGSHKHLSTQTNKSKRRAHSLTHRTNSINREFSYKIHAQTSYFIIRFDFDGWFFFLLSRLVFGQKSCRLLVVWLFIVILLILWVLFF